jgi:hypothetical protein
MRKLKAFGSNEFYSAIANQRLNRFSIRSSVPGYVGHPIRHSNSPLTSSRRGTSALIFLGIL